MSDDVLKQIEQTVKSHPVVLYMKGTASLPQCGFSAAVVEVLNKHKVSFETVDVLADPAVRDGVKRYSNWPTIPQLFVHGKLVGGSDIVRDLDAKGELAPMLRGAEK